MSAANVASPSEHSERLGRLVRRDVRQDRVDRVLRVAPGLPNPESFHTNGTTWIQPLRRSTRKQREYLLAAGFVFRGGYWVKA